MDPSRRSRSALFGALAALTLIVGIAAPAGAAFPYKSGTGDASDPYAYEKYMYIDDAETDFPPDDPKLTDPYEDFWKYTSKDACEVYGLPDNAEDLENHRCDPTVVANPQELFGVMGASVDLAWETSTGRPDVVIAVHDSGIEWDNAGAMRDLARKTWLNAGELPEPDWGHRNPDHPYDRNSDGVFNIVDYCGDIEDELDCGGQGDSRVRGAAGTNDTDFNANGLIDPEELIFLFSDGTDDDQNGYVDDFVGWDTFEDDNDPYDEPHYGHGTGEAKDSTAETDNGVDQGGTCPNCMVMHMRVGDSFVADVNDFAQGVLYATDNGASVIQSALGTLNNSRFAQEAINYAYERGTVLIASAADESAGHHNQPSALEHAVVMNSVGEPQVPGMMPRTYLEFRGCTNYGAYITASVPSNSCSSEAVGRSAGMAGLIYAAARNELAKNGPLQDYGALDGAGGVPEGMGVSAEELDQIIATTSDDINFRTPIPMDERTGVGGHVTERYPATEGWDPFFGYGRVNADRMVEAVAQNKIPPEADITSPRWFEIVDPDDVANGELEVLGRVASLRSPKFSYTVEWAPWSWREPHTETSPAYTSEGVTLTASGDRTQPVEGEIATIDMATLEAAVATEALPNLDASGPAVDPATGRGDHENRNLPDKFGVILRVTATAKDADGVELTDIDGDPLQGVGTKNFNLHRDPALFNGFPRFLEGDGAAGPRFADLNDDGDDEMIVATSNGEIHAYEHGGGELDGWPVMTTSILVNPNAPAYNSGEITPPHAAVLRTPAVGDLDRDGDLEVVAGDFQGRMWAWNNEGEVLDGFPVRSNPFFSAPQMSDRADGFYTDNPQLKPGNYPGPGALPNDPDLVPDIVNRRNNLNRTIFWFMAAPSLGNIDASNDDLEIVAGAGDRHVYAWHSDGEPVDGWPVMLRDPAVVDSVDPDTHEVSQDEERWNGAKIVTSPSIGDLDGDGVPEVLSAVNEQYSETPNTDDPALQALQDALTVADMSLDMGNQRLYAIYADGADHGEGPGTPASGHPNANAFLPGWPAKIATAYLEILPVVGNGPDGSAALANVNGGDDLEAGIFGTVGPAYILGPDGRSIYGQDEEGRDRTLSMSGAGPATNSPSDAEVSIPAVGGGIFTDLNEDGNLEFPAPAAGLGKLLDLALPDDQINSDNHLSVWETQGPRERQQAPAYPREVNDLQFLTTPSSADIDGDGFEEVLEGTAYSDLHALDYEGDEPGMRTLAPDGWPKFTGGWSVSPPAVGDFDGNGQRDVAHTIREGELFLWEGNGADRCADASWPGFAHDGWNSNNATLDAIRPNKIEESPPQVFAEFVTLAWKAPGDDEPCGSAAVYDFRRSDQPITNDNFDAATPLADEPTPAEAGTMQAMTIPRQTCDYYVGLRALDLRAVDVTQAQPANPSSVSDPVKVPGTNQASCREPTTLTYTGKTKGQVTDPTRLAAKLTGPQDGPIQGAELTFEFAGKTYEATTGNDGEAEVVVPKIPRPAQKRTVKVGFAGTDTLLPDQLSVPFTVRREDTVLKIIDGEPHKISARLQDKDSGKLVKQARVKFFVNGKLIGSDRTNDSGVAFVKRKRAQRPGDVEKAVFPRTKSFRRSMDKLFVP